MAKNTAQTISSTTELWKTLRASIDADLATLSEEREQLEIDKRKFEEMKTKIASVHFPSNIKLAVGGHVFKTTLATLTKEDSMLARMFSGKGFLVEKDEDGCYFIDRPGEFFAPILTYLQTGVFLRPKNPQKLKAIEQEADFYQIQSLLDKIRKHRFEFSNVNDNNGILYWLGTEKGNSQYQNPLTRGLVKISGSNNPVNMVAPASQRGDGGMCNSALNRPIEIDLCGLDVLPTSYSLSAGSQSCHNPANWKLEGFAKQSQKWILLSNHTNDRSLQSRTNYQINCQEILMKFQLTCTGADQVGNSVCYCFHVGQFEVYGDVLCGS